MSLKRKRATTTPAAASRQTHSTNPPLDLGADIDASISSNTQTLQTPTNSLPSAHMSGTIVHQSTGESSSSTRAPVVDPYAGYAVIHYRNSECKVVKKGMVLPPEPFLHRRPVLTSINAGGYSPREYHPDGLRVTRIIIHLLESNIPTWKKHDRENVRENCFKQFQKFFDFPFEKFKCWDMLAGICYKYKMDYRRKLGLKYPEVKVRDGELWEGQWATPEWLQKSAQGRANRAKNPCGNTQHYLGRRGVHERLIEYKRTGEEPDILKRCEIQFLKKIRTEVPDAEGEIHVEEVEVFANPHAQAAYISSKNDIARLSQPDPNLPPTPLTALQCKHIIAKNFGIGKRGHVIGLGIEAAEVVPPSKQRKSRTATLEMRSQELEDNLHAVAQEKEALKQRLDEQSRQLAEALGEMEQQKLGEAARVAEIERRMREEMELRQAAMWKEFQESQERMKAEMMAQIAAKQGSKSS